MGCLGNDDPFNQQKIKNVKTYLSYYHYLEILMFTDNATIIFKFMIIHYQKITHYIIYSRSFKNRIINNYVTVCSFMEFNMQCGRDRAWHPYISEKVFSDTMTLFMLIFDKYVQTREVETFNFRTKSLTPIHKLLLFIFYYI